MSSFVYKLATIARDYFIVNSKIDDGVASCVTAVEEELVRNLHADFNLLDDGTLVGGKVGDVANLKEVDVLKSQIYE
jgi:hypothetical protein